MDVLSIMESSQQIQFQCHNATSIATELRVKTIPSRAPWTNTNAFRRGETCGIRCIVGNDIYFIIVGCRSLQRSVMCFVHIQVVVRWVADISKLIFKSGGRCSVCIALQEQQHVVPVGKCLCVLD